MAIQAQTRLSETAWLTQVLSSFVFLDTTGLTDAGTSRAAEGTAACDSSHFVDELGKAVEQVRRVFGEIGGNAPFVDAGVEKARDVGAILWAIGG